MKRILHIVGKMDRAGAETMLMNLYRNIDRSQVQFDFMVFTEDEGDYDEEIKSLGGEIIPLIAKNNWERLKKMTVFFKQNHQYEVVHCHMLLNSMFPLLAAKLARVKMRIAHSHSTKNRKYGFKAKLYEKFAKKIIASTATHRIACGKAAAEYLFPNENNVEILLNGVDLDELTVIKERFLNQKLSDAKINILQVGRLSDVKNPSFSIDIANELNKQNFDFKLFFVGQGPLKEDMENRINDYKLKDKVKLLGVRSDVAELMAKADLLIMPSFHEGFPVVLVESQAIGLHALVSSQVSEEVNLGVNLVEFLKIDVIDEWVDKIKTYNPDIILNSQDRYQKLTQAGLNVKENASKLQSIYYQIL